MFAAVRGNENKKLMETEGLKDRIGSVGNQFCITSILGFLLSIPFVLVKEGSRFGEFVEAFKTVPALRSNMIASALWFYGYNELSTMTLKKTVSAMLLCLCAYELMFVVLWSLANIGSFDFYVECRHSKCCQHRQACHCYYWRSSCSWRIS